MPLWAELAAIRPRRQADWVIVDDVHAFDRPPEGQEADWRGINTETILEAIDATRTIRSKVIGDQLVIWRNAV